MSRRRGVKATVRTDFRAKDLEQVMDKVLVEFTNRVTTRLQQSIKVTLSQPGTGKKYPGLNYTSAAKGKPPTVQSGTLRRSWVSNAARTKPKKKKTGVSLTLGTNVLYARPLDRGSHPFIRPALKSGRFRTAIRSEIRRLKKKTKQAIAGAGKKRKVVR